MAAALVRARRPSPGRKWAPGRPMSPAASPPNPPSGATLASWRARKRRPATICRSWWTMPRARLVSHVGTRGAGPCSTPPACNCVLLQALLGLKPRRAYHHHRLILNAGRQQALEIDVGHRSEWNCMHARHHGGWKYESLLASIEARLPWQARPLGLGMGQAQYFSQTAWQRAPSCCRQSDPAMRAVEAALASIARMTSARRRPASWRWPNCWRLPMSRDA